MRSKVDKAARVSPKDRKHVALFLLQKALDEDIPAVKTAAAFRYVFHLPSEWKWAQIPFSEELSTESSLKWSKQLAEWLQWVGSLANRLNIIALLHILNGSPSREWSGIL